MTTAPVHPLNTSDDGEGLADPLLEHRIAAAADLARHEERLRVAAMTALKRWTALVQAAVLGEDTLTAAATELPPDPNAIPPLSAQWSAILTDTVDAELTAMLGDIFGQILTDEQTVSARPWQESYIADVHNRLVGVPDSTFDLIRDILAAGQADGSDIPTLRGLISDALATRGETTWSGRAETIARSESMAAWNGGQLQAWKVQATATGDVREKVFLATIDRRTRRSHYRADGQRVALDAKFVVGKAQLDHPGDPHGPADETVNCLPPGSLISWTGQAVLSSMRRGYAGPLVELRTVRGHVLTVTPNHPVLTPAGYRSAGSLRPGDQVIASTDPVRALPEVADGPARVEELHTALRETGVTQRVMGRGVDFHGDGSTGEEVEIVWADRDLLEQVDSGRMRPLGERALMGVGDRPVAFLYPSGRQVLRADDLLPGGRLGSEDCGVGRLAQRTALLDAEPAHAQPVGLAGAADGETKFTQSPGDDRAADPEGKAHLQHALALGMTASELVQVDVQAGYHGDVHNISTTAQWYSANGIALHNCRCTMLVVAADEELPDTADRQLRPPGQVQAEIDRRAANGDLRASDDPDAPTGPRAPGRQESPPPRPVPAAGAARLDALVEQARATPGEFARPSEDLMHATFTHPLVGKNGASYSARVRKAVEVDDNEWMVAVDLTDAEGTVIGTAKRSLWQTKNGPQISHDVFAINPEHQNQGLGTQLNVATEAFYRTHGVTHIKTVATSGHGYNGSYVWARRGFTWADTDGPADVGRALARLGSDDPAVADAIGRLTGGRLEDMPSPYEVSELPDGAGKAALLDTTWNGVRWLVDDSGLTAAAGPPSREFIDRQERIYRASLDDPELDDPDVDGDPDDEDLNGGLTAVAGLPGSGEQIELTGAPDTPGVDTVTAAGSGPGDASTEGTPMPRTWVSDPYLAPFAEPTGDGRIFAVGSLHARDLPLPLLFQQSSGLGHEGSVVVGRITDVQFTDAGIVASGEYLDDESVAADVDRAAALTGQGLGHVSVDLAAVTAELVDPDGNPVDWDDLFEAWERGDDLEVLEQVTAGELIAVTQVATPAFAGAKIRLGSSTAALIDTAGVDIGVGDIVDVTTEEGTLRGRVTAVDEPTTTVTVQPVDADGNDTTDAPLSVAPDAVTVISDVDEPTEPAPTARLAPAVFAADAAGVEITVGDTVTVDLRDAAGEVVEAGVEGVVTAVVDAAGDTPAMVTLARADGGDPVSVPAGQVTVTAKTATPAPVAALAGQAPALVAGVGPLRPARAWFHRQPLTGPTALTVTDDGQVFGHVAQWGQCHVGFANTCWTAPESASDYAYFHVGEVVCDNGEHVAVGNLTLGPRHADARLGYRAAIEHYDSAGAGVAVVRCYEDDYGIQFAGALTPGVSEEQLYDLRRCPVSGDWRKIGGQLDLIGVLSVNSGGYPTPRFATDDYGRTALVAAPGVPVPELDSTIGRTRRPVLTQAQLMAKIKAEIRAEMAADDLRRRRLATAATSIRRDPRSRLDELAARVTP
jgi:GNAT superfamily N-acetyltransferase